MPRSCDPVFFLDNPVNNTRRRGALQLSQMALGRPEEIVATNSPTHPPLAKSRGLVKRWQVESFAVILRHLSQNAGQRLRVVDFGCGTGTLLLPLAWMFPQCHFTGVEMKPAAVALLLERARAAGLSNVSGVRGMIEDYTDQPFDVCMALHACGNATDAAMLLAAKRRAAYIVSPCCVGKLKFSMAGGSSFSSSLHVYTPRMPGDRPVSRTAAPAAPAAALAAAAAVCHEGKGRSAADEGASAQAAHQSCGAGRSAVEGEEARPAPSGGEEQAPAGAGQRVVLGELRHPRSHWLWEHLPDPEKHFRIMAKVADQNHSGAPEPAAEGVDTGPESVAATAARICKANVELDRNLAAKEEGYSVGLFKCFQWESMAKNDLLVGVPTERSEWAGLAGLLE